jgi:hypothetical protein
MLTRAAHHCGAALCLALQVTTVTSDLRGAGTDANVHLVMHGTLGDGVRHILTSGHDDFDRCCA